MIPDKLYPSRQERDKAQKIIDKLAKEKRLKPGQEKTLSSAREVIERVKRANQIIMAVAGLGVLGATSAAIYCSDQKENKPEATQVAASDNSHTPVNIARPSLGQSPANSNHTTPDSVDPQSELARINKIENAFMKFAEKVAEKAKKYDPEHADVIAVPCKVMGENLGNKQKSLTEIRATLKGDHTRIHQESPSHFYYGFAAFPDNNGPAAAFSDISREVTLNAKFDTEKLTDMFLLYHELLHVKDDEIRRSRMKTDMPGYAQSLMLTVTSPQKVAFLNDECNAHSLTLRAMNAYFNGELQKKGERITREEVARLLGITLTGEKDMNWHYATMITQESQTYFDHSITASERDNNFFQLIGRAHVQEGMTLYNMDPQGYPYPLQVVKK